MKVKHIMSSFRGFEEEVNRQIEDIERSPGVAIIDIKYSTHVDDQQVETFCALIMYD